MTFKRSISELIQTVFEFLFCVCRHRTKEMCYIFNSNCNIRHWHIKKMTDLRGSEHLDSVSVHYDTPPHRVYSTNFLKQKQNPGRYPPSGDRSELCSFYSLDFCLICHRIGYSSCMTQRITRRESRTLWQHDSWILPAQFASIPLSPQSFYNVGKVASRGND